MSEVETLLATHQKSSEFAGKGCLKGMKFRLYVSLESEDGSPAQQERVAEVFDTLHADACQSLGKLVKRALREDRKAAIAINQAELPGTVDETPAEE